MRQGRHGKEIGIFSCLCCPPPLHFPGLKISVRVEPKPRHADTCWCKIQDAHKFQPKQVVLPPFYARAEKMQLPIMDRFYFILDNILFFYFLLHNIACIYALDNSTAILENYSSSRQKTNNFFD